MVACVADRKPSVPDRSAVCILRGIDVSSHGAVGSTVAHLRRDIMWWIFRTLHFILLLFFFIMIKGVIFSILRYYFVVFVKSVVPFLMFLLHFSYFSVIISMNLQVAGLFPGCSVKSMYAFQQPGQLSMWKHIEVTSWYNNRLAALSPCCLLYTSRCV